MRNEKSAKSMANKLRALPSVERVLAMPALTQARADLPHALVTDAVRGEIEAARRAIIDGYTESPTPEEVAGRAATRAWASIGASLRPVINATGVIIHTNLGRAPLSDAAQRAVREAASYSNLEYDLDDGARGSRYTHAVEVLRRVTGCEDALVVNNNAAALVLVLSAFAREREVVVSRGQLVEIGGGFRVPEIMAQSGARLKEVGTTNRTYLADYEAAITPETATLMRIHASNFRIVGFATQPALEELSGLAQERGVLLVDDIGSGALFDTTRFGLLAEPTVQESLKAGVDACLFSGDKLLGGPQCGIILGKWAVVERLKRHPLVRALRVDKMTLAALEATLIHYLKGEAEREVPVWRMISLGLPELEQRARSWASHLTDKGLVCDAREGRSAVGGGSLPGETLPTWVVSVSPPGEAGTAAARLRASRTPVIARVEDGRLLLDPRTVLAGQEELLLEAVSGLVM
jgi:L-seryl-tRNA(Ser) seleniumtransferase